jgi:hypothetical protein
MKKLLYPTNAKIMGPWLVENRYIIELDFLADKIMEKAIEFNNSEISNKTVSNIDGVDLKKTFPYNNEKKEFVIEFFDNTKLVGTSIQELIKNPEIKNKKASFIKMNIERGNFIFDLEINKRKFLGPLEYNIKCKDNELALDVKYEVDRWLKPFKPSPLMSMWKFSVLLWIFFFLFFKTIQDNKTLLKVTFDFANKAEAVMLVKKGINDSTIYRAVELLLVKTYDMEVKDKDYIVKQRRDMWILLFSMVILLFLSFSPNTNIGIGRGEVIIKRWKLYIKLIYIVIPLNIILPILINLITK